MKLITAGLFAFFLTSFLVVTTCSAEEKSKGHKKPPELADLVVGTYHGDVVSDSRGSSRSDVTVTVTKVDKWTVRVTSDYSRLGAVNVRLTRIGSKVLNADGDSVFLLDLEQRPLKLEYNPHNEVAYVGNRQ
jgi:hypothetical protein